MARSWFPWQLHQAKRMHSVVIVGWFAAATLLVAFASPLAAADDDANPHIWKTRTTSAAVFKNGFGFFMREGDVALRDGWCQAREIPPAAFGTFGVYSLNEGESVDIVGAGPGEVVAFDGVDAPKDEAAIRARLETAMGVNVELTYSEQGGRRQAAGKLRSVGTDFVVLEFDGGRHAVPVAAIEQMQTLDLPLRAHVSADGDATPTETRLGMAYLRSGITWVPEYTLKILDDDTAELSLRGTLVNEAEDLVHCDVHFVVGVPHFMHTEYLTPIAVGQAIRTLGTAMAPAQVQSQIMNRAAIANNLSVSPQSQSGPPGAVTEPVAPESDSLGALVGSLPRIESAAGADYTVYTKKDLTVRRGEKAMVTLFRQKVRYSHIYRWTPPGAMEHSLVLHNATDTAWTTGPCLVVSDARPLSEDLLRYAPRGGRAELPITAAVNLAHERIEREVDRKLKAYDAGDDDFLDLVTLEGSLTVKNFEPRVVDIEIAAPVAGRPIEASDDGGMSVDPEKLQLLDRSGTVRWRIRLEQGGEKQLRYKYERYVPSR